MKVLIIGSGGQLGTDCMTILARNHQVTGIDYPDIDIGESASVEKTVSKEQPDCVVNCAAYTAVDGCESEKQTAWKINRDGPRFIAQSTQKLGCRLIHISTDYVFDGKKPVPEAYEETDQVNPLSEYGKSKLAGEQAIIAEKTESLILRTAWLYSAHGPNFLKTMLKLALSDSNYPFTIVHDQFGSLTWSHTLARQIEVLLDSSLTGIVHATSTGFSSWYEAACYFLKKMDIPHAFTPCTTEQYPTPAHRPANSILANRILEEKRLSVFGSWQKDVDTYVELFRKQLIEEAMAMIKG